MNRDAASRFWERRAAGLVVVALALVLFAPTFVFGRVDFDDMWLWSDDSPLRHLNAQTLHELFFQLDAQARHPFGTEYLPIRDLFVAFDMAIWGDNEHGLHVVQVLLFAGTAYGLGTALIRFGVDRSVAWIGTLLWVAHPLHVESVAWLSERKGVLCGAFIVICAHAWVRYRNHRSAWWLVLAAASAIAAVWSKAPGMFGVAAITVLDLCLLAPSRRRWIAIGSVFLATLLAAIPVVVVARGGRIIGEGDALDVDRVHAVIGSAGHYVETFLCTRPPSIAYPIQTDGPGWLELVLGAIALATYALFARKPSGLRGALVGWAVLWFIPISHAVVPVHIFAADRFVYLWSFAPCVALAWCATRLKPPLPILAVALTVTVLGIFTVRAEQSWTNSTELFTRATHTNPRDAAAWENLALALVADARTQEALQTLDRGLAHRPNHPYLLARKAKLLDALHQREQAIAVSYQAAAQGVSSVMWSHAVLLRSAGRFGEALPFAERAARNHPELTVYARTRAQLLVDLGRAGEAEAVLLASLAIDWTAVETHYQAERLFLRLGRPAQAALHRQAREALARWR